MARRNENGQFVSDDDTTDDVARDDAPQTDDDGLVRDDDGGLIDPPVIQSFEQELAAAHALGDDDAIGEIQERYTEAREDRARTLAARERQEA